ncbi:hypothetical protein SAMN02745978_00492 [Butyricicoccus pullicaecorum DSM 23266]|uniref:Uncharacterized protein n=1 Tax=Butyricicoccus pullicaecorum 1.2 TaxID=1203606 RepID=R8W1B0_9FIRM|nr:hypothetical protein HMPREF1526_01361 [Butyricicoccus pullicaecorum 1.2]SKA54206.1 hypothetical protein SAMN02745978_00492 [Butyricicoccus pullicaecorum DSM 23266]
MVALFSYLFILRRSFSENITKIQRNHRNNNINQIHIDIFICTVGMHTIHNQH